LIGDKSQQYFALSKKGQPIDTARAPNICMIIHLSRAWNSICFFVKMVLTQIFPDYARIDSRYTSRTFPCILKLLQCDRARRLSVCLECLGIQVGSRLERRAAAGSLKIRKIVLCFGPIVESANRFIASLGDAQT
jgi:hypothetical protein